MVVGGAKKRPKIRPKQRSKETFCGGGVFFFDLVFLWCTGGQRRAGGTTVFQPFPCSIILRNDGHEVFVFLRLLKQLVLSIE